MMKGILIAGVLAGAALAQAEDFKPTVGFSGYVDADFRTLFADSATNTASSDGFENPYYTYGLEMKLTTTIGLSDAVKAYVYTAAYDGMVPGQGADIGVPAVQFDGFNLDWQLSPTKHVYFGDQIFGQGFFNYYFYKRSAAVIGKHWSRGAAVQLGGFYLQTGADLNPGGGMGRTWTTSAKYDIALNANMTLTPALNYTAGIPGYSPSTAGISYVGKFGGLTLNAHGAYATDMGKAANGKDSDPNIMLLIEPVFATGPITLSGTIFWQDKGDNVSTMVGPMKSYGNGPIPEDLLVYFEPDYTVNGWLTVGSTFEYHNYDKAYRAATTGDEFWIVPTAYIAPAKGVTVIPYVQVYLEGTQGHPASTKYPSYQAGSEVVVNF